MAYFLKFLEYFLKVIFCDRTVSAQAEAMLKPIQIPTLTQALQGGQSLPSIPLLDTDVNVIGLGSNVTSISKRIAFLGKRIYRR